MFKSTMTTTSKQVKSSIEPGKTQNFTSTKFQIIQSGESDVEDSLNTSTSTTASIPEAPKSKIFSRNELQSLMESLKVSQAKTQLPPQLLKLTKRTVRTITKKWRSSNPNPVASKVMIEEKKEDPAKFDQPLGKKFREEVKIDDNEAIKRQLRMKFNILAEDNYDLVKLQILDFAAKNEEICKTALTFIMKNAWDQPKYTKLYAKLCFFLSNNEKMPKEGGKSFFFRNLVNQLQEVLNSLDRDYQEFSPEDVGEIRSREHRKDMANIKFIGELYNHGVIKKQLFRVITGSLLEKFITNYLKFVPSDVKPKFIVHEDILEGFIVFYETIAASFDKEPKSNLVKDNANEIVKLLEAAVERKNVDLSKLFEGNYSEDHFFRILETTLKKCKLSSRISSLIQNLIQKRIERI